MFSLSIHPKYQKESKEFIQIEDTKEQLEYLRNKKLWVIEFIFSFNEIEQQFAKYLIQRTTTDLEFLTEVFQVLSLDELKDLMKISSCMECAEDEDFPDFLDSIGGKFYFNIDRNEDFQTKAYHKHKQEYILSRSDNKRVTRSQTNKGFRPL